MEVPGGDRICRTAVYEAAMGSASGVAIPRFVGEHRLAILHHTLEPIREGGPPEGHMLVMQIGEHRAIGNRQ